MGKLWLLLPGAVCFGFWECLSTWREGVMNTDHDLAIRLAMYGKWGTLVFASFYPLWGLWWCIKNLRILKKGGVNPPTISIIDSEKSKLDRWEELLSSAKACGEKIFHDPTNDEYLKLFENLHSGILIMLGKEHETYDWFHRITSPGYDQHLSLISEFPKSSLDGNKFRLQGSITTILNCIRNLENKKPPFTSEDFKDFPVKDIEKYIGGLNVHR